MADGAGKRSRSPAERRAEKAEVDDPRIVLEAALRFLEPRARSTMEVRRRLVSAGYRVELVDESITRLTDLGVLDDEHFAREWVRSRDRAHPRGERALRSELHGKGISDVVIATILAERATAVDGGDVSDADADAARRLLERKASMLARSGEPRQLRQRAYALLVRNGFSSELSWRLAAELTASTDSEK